MDWQERAHASVLARRVPREDIEVGATYRIHARNGGVGVAVLDEERGMLGYRLRREKLGATFLFIEWDWEDSETVGTAIPLERLDTVAPDGDDALLAWLGDLEAAHADSRAAVWDEIMAAMLSPERGGTGEQSDRLEPVDHSA